jgi:hypothetical protein
MRSRMCFRFSNAIAVHSFSLASRTIAVDGWARIPPEDHDVTFDVFHGVSDNGENWSGPTGE